MFIEHACTCWQILFLFRTCLRKSELWKIGKSGSEGKNLVSILIIECKLPIVSILKRNPQNELSENHSSCLFGLYHGELCALCHFNFLNVFAQGKYIVMQLCTIHAENMLIMNLFGQRFPFHSLDLYTFFGSIFDSCAVSINSPTLWENKCIFQW